MSDPTDRTAKLRASAAQYRAAKQAYEQAREEINADIVAALIDGQGPTFVAREAGFTDAHVRAIARAHKVPPAKPGIKKRPKA